MIRVTRSIRANNITSEYDANRKLHESAVRYSAEWMKPSRHIYQHKKRNWIVRLVRWIAGFAYGN